MQSQRQQRQRYILGHGPNNSYVVRDAELMKRRKASIVFSSPSKTEAIAQAQKLSGFEVDGDENTYGRQQARK